MQYVSTRGHATPVGFEQVLVEGQAPDGGLYLPSQFPLVADRLESWRQHTFQELAYEITSLYATDTEPSVLSNTLEQAFATFDHVEITPLVELGDQYILELFHGPTLAFKDIALQVLGRLFEHVLSERDQVMNILGATSGDTGSAAIAGVRGRSGLGIFIMFPDGRISPQQELQMTSVLDSNVHCLAIDGSFDDCQLILKTIFNQTQLKQRFNLGAVNSINWARIMVQIVYYFYSALRFQEPVNFSVPTGNFGNILSAIIAKRMGAPIRQLILGTNENDILARFFASGQYQRGDLHQTLSPSMDIQVASNLERFIYLCLDGQTARLREFMTRFSKEGSASIESDGQVDASIVACRIDRETTLKTIEETWKESGYLLDPHTAVGVAASASCPTEGPVINLATAHPAKFPDAVEEATGSHSINHPSLEKLRGRETRKVQLPNSIEAVQDYLEQHAIS